MVAETHVIINPKAVIRAYCSRKIFNRVCSSLGFALDGILMEALFLR